MKSDLFFKMKTTNTSSRFHTSQKSSKDRPLRNHHSFNRYLASLKQTKTTSNRSTKRISRMRKKKAKIKIIRRISMNSKKMKIINEL